MRYKVGDKALVYRSYKDENDEWQKALITVEIKRVFEDIDGYLVVEYVPAWMDRSGEDREYRVWRGSEELIDCDDSDDKKSVLSWGSVMSLMLTGGEEDLEEEDEEEDDEDDYEEEDSDEDFEEDTDSEEEDERVEGYTEYKEDKREVLSWYSVKSLMLTGEDEYDDDS